MSEAVPVATDASKKRRSGWWFLAAMVGGFILLCIGSLALWLWSDRDLREVKARITAAGFPVSYAELGRTKSSPERCAQWERLQWLFSPRNKTRMWTGNYSESSVGSPGSELPPELIKHYADLSETLVNESDALIDEIGDRPVVLNPGEELKTDINWYFLEYVFERALIAPPAQLEAALNRLFCVTRWARVGDGACKLRLSTVRPAKALIYRFKELSSSARVEFAAQLRSLLDQPEKFIAEAQANNLIWELADLTPPDEDSKFLQRLKERGLGVMPLIETTALRQLYMRAGRAGFLEQELEQARLSRDHKGDLHALQARLFPRGTSWNLRIYNPVEVVAFHMKWNRGDFMLSVARAKQFNDLVAAVLTNEPWPVDWFDPTGARLRPVLRNGIVVGAYSVWKNGVDDGGVFGEDLRWALFGPIEP